MSTDFLPPIPKPPHDPTSWRLDARIGWHESASTVDVEQAPCDGALILVPRPGSGRSLTEDSGSFGGVTPPFNVTVGPGGDIFLLDAATLELKRFDPCDCAFTTVPCFGGEGGGPRQLRNPHGIAICSGNLYVCDTGLSSDPRTLRENHRVSVFALRGFALRGHLRPPASAWAPSGALTAPWEPYDLAFDRHGRIYVTDGANGCVHRFSPSGRWETCLGGFGQAQAIAIDCEDRLYVVVDGTPRDVRIVDTDGRPAGDASRPERLAARFPCTSFATDADGNVHLGPLCTELEEPPNQGRPPRERGVFDRHGRRVQNPAPPTAPSYQPSGTYYSRPLDSELYRCQWHRLILRGELPTGARITASTYTAEAIETDSDIQALANDAWETQQTAYALKPGEPWDCLVRSGPGRYLWLKLELAGNGASTPCIESIELEFPRISLRRYLPAVFGAEPTSADFTDRFLSLFDTTLRSVETRIDNLARYFDPLSTPTVRNPKTGLDFLTWLGSWIGLSVDRHWPEAKRRRLLKSAGRLYDVRGTRAGLWRQLLLFLDMDPEKICCADDQPRSTCEPKPRNCAPMEALPCAWRPPPLILEHYLLRRWLFVGAGRLGEQAVLWGKRIVNRSQLDGGAQVAHSQLISTQDPRRDPFHVYAHKFTVFVPASVRGSDQRRKSLENLLKAESPAHARYDVHYVEPRFRIGFQSMIGFDSVVGRLPQGVTLDATRLGPASVLTAPAHQQGGPSFAIAKDGRIGTTTKLN